MPPEDTSAAQPDSGPPAFSFDRLIVREIHFEQVERVPVGEEEKRPKTVSTPVDLALGVQVHREKPMGQVTLKAVVRPDLKWQPYRIEVVVSGTFGAHGNNATPQLFDEFCKRAVPSILFPYLRQIIHMVTADAAFGVVRLNPINLQQLFADDWPSDGEAKPTSTAP